MNHQYKLARPKKPCKSRTALGIGQSWTADTFTSATDTPSFVVTCPTNSTLSRNNAHFLDLTCQL